LNFIACRITNATFYGLLPTGVSLSNINFVGVEIYRVFPLDSVNPPSGNVPTRVNSPSDNAFGSRDSASGLTFTATLMNNNFSVANTVINGINRIPNQTTGGEGPATGQEVLINITFTTPLFLPADHYFFKPEVGLSSSGNFLWLSAATPPQFTGDLQAWIRNTNLDPDWLRIGTDIVGGTAAPKFNMAFTLTGQAMTTPPTFTLLTEAGTNNAVAIDSVTQVRGPFSISQQVFNFSTDHHTRVMLFTSQLGLSQSSDLSVLSVQAQDSLGQIYQLPVEQVGTLPGVDQISFIIVRLVDQLPPGTLLVSVTLRGVTSNQALISVIP
jgi:hypothetical protein